MNQFAFSALFVLVAVLVSTSDAAVGNSRYHAAKCLAKRDQCTAELQRQSGACKAGTLPSRQSKMCRMQACAWCKVPGKNSLYPCNSATVRSICKGRRTGPMPPTTKPPTTKPPSVTSKSGPPSGGPAKEGCTWMGSGGMVVVDLGKVKGKDGWTPVTNGGLNGLIFRKEKTHGIVGAGSEGKMCFSIKPGMAGDYMATAVSAAPHGSDNNDMWFGSSKGWKLLQAGSFYTPDPKPFEFRKAYQNMGGRRLADYISTKDHDGHYFVAPNVGENETIQICIAGRSYKYEVFKIILVKCNSRFCTGGRGAERGSLVKKAASKCT